MYGVVAKSKVICMYMSSFGGGTQFSRGCAKHGSRRLEHIFVRACSVANEGEQGNMITENARVMSYAFP
jgi:hypothetical protein